MNFTETGSYTYNGETVEFHYSPTALYMKQATFVDSVTNAVIVNGNYIPLLKDVLFNLKLVQMFADIDMGQFNDDDGLNIDKFAEFDEITGVSETLKALINDDVIDNLITSVNDNIAYRTGIHKDNVSTAIIELINTAKDRISTFGEGLNSDIVMDFIQKFSESGIDGESIVKAYLDSDQYKENVADVVDAKNSVIQERDSKIADLEQKFNKVTARNVVADTPDKVISIKGE